MSERPARGKVYLVGAGPGDPGLVTVAATRRLREADVVVYDRLAAPSLLQYAREGAELIFVGKEGGGICADQAAINRLLVEKAREGKRVVRLKGGDPFVFGRGGEEAESLRAAGVPFEVVPGVTSAVAVPAYAGIPVTHRGLATSFAVITGHEDPAKDESGIRWDRIARGADTLVFLMGVRTLAEIVRQLVAHGRPESTPAAVIRWGTTSEQRTVTGTLGDIANKVEAAGLAPPAVTVVGEVVRLRETLSWFETRPLFGRRVLVTRTRRQASALAALLAEEGAVPIELPAIEIEPVPGGSKVEAALVDLQAGRYAWVVFTSANAVEIWFALMRERGLDARAFAGSNVAAIGPATAEALSRRGIAADLVPQEFVAEGVVEAMRPYLSVAQSGTPLPARGEALESTRGVMISRSRECRRILVPRAAGARPELVEGLRSLGAQIDEVILYRAAVPQSVPAEALSLLREGAIDIVTFTSSSTVRNLASLLGADVQLLRGPLIACIGPITAATARELGLRVDVVATEHTIEGLVAALRERGSGL